MQKNMLLIVNPKAGKGTIKRKLPKKVKPKEVWADKVRPTYILVK